MHHYATPLFCQGQPWMDKWGIFFSFFLLVESVLILAKPMIYGSSFCLAAEGQCCKIFWIQVLIIFQKNYSREV